MKRRVLLKVSAILLILFTVIAVVSLRLKYSTHLIVGDGMSPTIVPSNPPDGKPDVVLCDKAWYDNHPVRRWDIVLFDVTGLVSDMKEPYLMRVVGLPGEQVSIGNGSIAVNGVETSSPVAYTPYYGSPHLSAGTKISVPRDCYIVLGDNPQNSRDSRFFGPVPRANIRARATRILEPAARAREF